MRRARRIRNSAHAEALAQEINRSTRTAIRELERIEARVQLAQERRHAR